MSVELEYLGIEKQSFEAMLVDDIYIGVVGEDGADEVAFFETIVGGFRGVDHMHSEKKQCEYYQDC